MALPIRPTNPKHFPMDFRFGSMYRALALRDAIRSLGLNADLVGGQKDHSWLCQTDTRCLAHAAKLTQFLGGSK